MKKIILIISILLSSTFIASANTNKDDKKLCSGFGKWSKEGEFKILRKKCITEKEYQATLSSKSYLCNYYQKSIWKESEREYGKKQYKWAPGSLEKIKSLKDQGKSLCDKGKLKQGEAKLKEAIKIISHTMMN
jgi:predicted small secreted protein